MSSDDSRVVARLNIQLAETISERDALKVMYDSKNQEDAILGARIATLDAECKRNRAHIVAQVALDVEMDKWYKLFNSLMDTVDGLVPSKIAYLNNRFLFLNQTIAKLRDCVDQYRDFTPTNGTFHQFCCYYFYFLFPYVAMLYMTQ
jgi:hypothetical protein